MSERYDAIVVGARCAGSPTAMLLARKGYRVLLVDRSSFPSDAVSTHLVHPPGIAALARWGLLEKLRATGCPPIEQYAFDFDCAVLHGTPPPATGAAVAYGPRRTVLDKLLVDAAVDAGVEVREGYTVEEVITDGGTVTGVRGHPRGGASGTETARVVIGADGRRSLVARAVGAAEYVSKPICTAGYYAYWSDLPIEEFQVFVRPHRACVVVPTHDDQRLVLVGWPRAEFAANKADIEGHYTRALHQVPQLADLLGAATRQTRFAGTGDMLNAFRTPFGPGWALVGDAGYVKDPCTAQGISDSFADAERLAGALDETLGGYSPYPVAMRRFHAERDAAVRPMFDFTMRLAAMKPLPAFMQYLFRAMQGNQQAMDTFMGVVAGTVPVGEFFAAANLAGIMANGLGRKVRSWLAAPAPVTSAAR